MKKHNMSPKIHDLYSCSCLSWSGFFEKKIFLFSETWLWRKKMQKNNELTQKLQVINIIRFRIHTHSGEYVRWRGGHVCCVFLACVRQDDHTVQKSGGVSSYSSLGSLKHTHSLLHTLILAVSLWYQKMRETLFSQSFTETLKKVFQHVVWGLSLQPPASQIWSPSNMTGILSPFFFFFFFSFFLASSTSVDHSLCGNHCICKPQAF